MELLNQEKLSRMIRRISFVNKKVVFDKEIFTKTLEVACSELRKTTDDISNETKINKKTIERIFNGDFSDFSSRVVLESTVRKIAQTLKLNPDPFCEFAISNFVGKSLFQSNQSNNYSASFFNVPKFFLVFSVIVFFVFGVYYIARQFYSFYKLPEIEIIQPIDGEISRSETVIITGRTDNGSRVFINGSRINVMKNGEFSKEVKLREGNNTFIIISESKLGRKSEKIIRVYFSRQGRDGLFAFL